VPAPLSALPLPDAPLALPEPAAPLVPLEPPLPPAPPDPVSSDDPQPAAATQTESKTAIEHGRDMTTWSLQRRPARRRPNLLPVSSRGPRCPPRPVRDRLPRIRSRQLSKVRPDHEVIDFLEIREIGRLHAEGKQRRNSRRGTSMNSDEDGDMDR
jgi:hypothetical protein